jgi:hypothetical protein
MTRRFLKSPHLEGIFLTQPDSIATRTFAVIRRRFFALLGATTWPYALSAIVHLSIGAVIRSHPSGGGQ